MEPIKLHTKSCERIGDNIVLILVDENGTEYKNVFHVDSSVAHTVNKSSKEWVTSMNSRVAELGCLLF